jgi:hypothetical protein
MYSYHAMLHFVSSRLVKYGRQTHANWRAHTCQYETLEFVFSLSTRLATASLAFPCTTNAAYVHLNQSSSRRKTGRSAHHPLDLVCAILNDYRD